MPAAAGGAVTLASPTTVGTLTFNQFTGTYTLGTAGQAITLNGGITLDASSGATTFVSPITLGGAQNWTNNSLNNAGSTQGSLSINNTLNLNGNALTIGGSGLTNLAGAAGSVVSGAGGISVTGGRLWLGSGNAPAHTYSGDTSISGGAVVMISGNASMMPLRVDRPAPFPPYPMLTACARKGDGPSISGRCWRRSGRCCSRRRGRRSRFSPRWLRVSAPLSASG